MLTYKRHAQKRMGERRISEEEIEYCLNNHDISYTDKKGNPIYITVMPNGRRVKVVVEKDNPQTVITVGD